VGLEGNLPRGGYLDLYPTHGSALHLQRQADRPIGQRLLEAGVALPARLELRLLDGVGLAELVQLLGESPEAVEVVVEQFAPVGQADREAPAIELDPGPLGDPVKEANGSPGGEWKLEAPAGGLQRGGVLQLRLDGDSMAHGEGDSWLGMGKGKEKSPAGSPGLGSGGLSLRFREL